MTTVANRQCWICRGPADSREHKFKKSDVSRTSKTWAADDQPYFVGVSGWRRIQGPDSELVKFGKVLCQRCNATKTQPFDRAYERFADWVTNKGGDLMTEGELDFGEIYGSSYQDSTLNLLKFFAKHLGCRIASAHHTMPPNFAASLATADLTPFEVSFARNAIIPGLGVRRPDVLHNFGLVGSFSPSKNVVSYPYLSGMIVGYLDVVYRYAYDRRFVWEGDPVIPSRRTVRLGEYIQGNPHLSGEDIPSNNRKIKIGEKEFSVPLLSLDHIRYIKSLELPKSGTTDRKNFEARLKVAHAILSPFYPDVTLNFLEENLTIPASDALWQCIFSPSAYELPD
jgi:hypothetical protein